MLDKIPGIAEAANTSPETARKAVAIILSLIHTQGHQQKTDALFAQMNGAATLAAEGSAGGGLLAKMAGGMMGGPLAAVSRMQSIGVSLEQSKIIHTLVVQHAQAAGGAQLVREAAGNIPGLSGYL